MNHPTLRLLPILILGLLAGGCTQLHLYSEDKGEVLARVGEKELYATPITRLIEPGLPQQDSLDALQSLVDNWVRKEIKTSAAEAALSGHSEEIEEMVAQYRSALVTYQYEQEWLAERLDTAVTNQQIRDYYDQHREMFRLAGPIVKALIVRLPSGLRQSRKLEEMFRSERETDRNDFLNICQKNQYPTHDFSTEWTDFSTVVRQLPFSYSNFDDFLRTRKYYDVEDDQYKYMLVIDAYRSTGDYSPLERETDNIRKIILNKRRQSLLTTLEDSLYQAAQHQHLFEIRLHP